MFISADRPPLRSAGLWLALAFNTAMAIRNTVWRPPFIMYYLSFLLPGVRRLLEEHGFDVEVHRGFCPEIPSYHLIIATRGT